MFVLDKKQFIKFNQEEAKQFIEFWESKYPGDKTKIFKSDETIDYLNELNLRNRLTEENIKRLLRWKDPRRLTEEKVTGLNKGKRNEVVSKVLENIEYINAFRFGKMNEKDFKEKIGSIEGIGEHIFQKFLFHIARPFEFPIADQNVFRAFSTQKKMDIPEDWNGYKHYIDYFFDIALSAGIIIEKPKGNENNLDVIVTGLKRVDNALFAFGQFLDTYD